jgi:hypothetical protein
MVLTANARFGLVVATLVILMVVLLSPFVLPIVMLSLFVLPVKAIAEEDDMLKSPPSPSKGKTALKMADAPADSLPFPGKLVDGKYDVQHLHL